MPKISKVVATVWYDKAHMYDLRRVFPDAEFVYVDFFDKDRLTEEVKDADAVILFGDVDNCLLGENSLKWIHCDHAGLNGSARPEVFERGIPVTGAAGRSAPVLAEHCIYFMLQHCYHTKELLDAQEKKQFGVPGSEKWRGLYGRTAGIIGMGNNGKHLAPRLKAMGMKVIGYDCYDMEGLDYVDEKLCSTRGDKLETLLQKSDFIILCMALNDDTYHMLNAETLKQVKPGAFLVNMARGGLVDTPAMIEALENGTLGGAGLDVFEEQPLSPESPLWEMPTVYITPHTTPQVPDRDGRSIEIILENARRFEAGEPLLNLMRKSDMMSGEGHTSGFAAAMNANMKPNPQIIKMLEKHLGKRGWTDPSEWM